MLGQMLRPDVYVATRPAAMAGTLLEEELYRLVSHRIEAVAAGDVLREYLCHLFFQLKEQDDLLCGMEHGCDVFAPLAWPEWKQEQAAREEREQTEREMERRREEDEEQAAIWAEREREGETNSTSVQTIAPHIYEACWWYREVDRYPNMDGFGGYVLCFVRGQLPNGR